MLSRRCAAALAALALGAGLPACGGDDGGRAAQTARATPTEADAPPLDGPLRYQRGGGFTGQIDRLAVEPDGSATLTPLTGEAKTFRLSGRELAELRAAAARTDLAAVPDETEDTGGGADDYGHRIEYRGRRIETDDESLPPQLEPLVGELSGLVDRYGGP